MKVPYFEIDKQLKQNARAFRRGKRDFTVRELSDIKLYLLRYKDCLDNTQFYEGTLKNFKVVSCFTDNFHEELLEFMIDKRDAAISIIVMLADKKVLFMKSQNCSINLCDLAKILCDGECEDTTTSIAGGELNSTFMNFTKILTPC